jgi:outer membrane protein OmpA-like peptidoglycan-associated protein
MKNISGSAANPVRSLLPALCAAALVAACASTPQQNDRLTTARTSFEQARANTARAEMSAAEMDRANAALQRAERAWRGGEDRVEVDHLSYIAQREVDLAVTSAQRRETERAIEQAARDRDAIQLEASRRRTDSAQAQATTAQMQATTAQMQAEQERQRADALAARLRDLQATQTQRGLVVTFSDVLFDVGRAELRSGALARVEQLAAVMREYPERNVLVEGFTDSTGSLATNQDLSERRAMSVRQALVARGIDPRRIVSRGHADRYPIADNTSASGRQQNRRVEAVLSDAKGELPMRP